MATGAWIEGENGKVEHHPTRNHCPNKMGTGWPKRKSGKIPAAKPGAFQVRLRVGPMTEATAKLAEKLEAQGATIVRGESPNLEPVDTDWDQKMAAKRKRDRIAQAQAKPTPKPTRKLKSPSEATVFYCAAPSCAHVAQAGSQYCGAHSAPKRETVPSVPESAEVTQHAASIALTPEIAFRLSGAELRDLLPSPVAQAEISRRQAKRAAKAAV